MLKSASGFKHIGTNIVLFNGACDLRLDRGIASAPLRRANMIPWFGGIPRRDAPVAAPRGLSSCSAGPPLFSSAVDQQVSIFQGKTAFIQGRHSLVRQLISFGLVIIGYFVHFRLSQDQWSTENRDDSLFTFFYRSFRGLLMALGFLGARFLKEEKRLIHV